MCPLGVTACGGSSGEWAPVRVSNAIGLWPRGSHTAAIGLPPADSEESVSPNGREATSGIPPDPTTCGEAKWLWGLALGKASRGGLA